MRYAVLVLAGLLALAARNTAGQPQGGVATAVNVSSSAGFSQTPRAAGIPGGGVAIAWREGNVTNAQIFLAHSADGETFASGRDISDTPGPSYIPSLALDPTERVHVAWREPLFPQGLIRYARAPDVDGAFTASRAISTAPPAFASDLAAADRGRLALAWDQDRRIRCARSSNGGGSWRTPAFVTGPSEEAWQARVRLDRAARAFVLYLATQGASGKVFLRVSGRDSNLFGGRRLVSREYPDAGEIALAVTPAGRALAAFVHLTGDSEENPDRVIVWRGRGKGRAVGVGHEPFLAIGPDGTVHLAWRSRTGEILYARSTNGGRSFGQAVNVSETPGGGGPHQPGFSSHPSVAIDGRGKVYIAWQEALTAENDEVFVRALL